MPSAARRLTCPGWLSDERMMIEEPGSNGGGLVADDELDNRDPGRHVDRGQLPHRTDALEPTDVESVQGDDLTGRGGV